MAFVHLLWLWLAAAVMVPVAVHLFSRQQGRVIKVGSLRFVPPSVPSRIRRAAFHEPLLFLVRALLTLALALIPTMPYLTATFSSAKGWVLVAPELEAYDGSKQFYLDLDSLQKNGYELRRFEKHFPPFRTDAQKKSSEPTSDFWSLLSEADKDCPSPLPMMVFMEPRVAALRGTRPTLQHTVFVKPYFNEPESEPKKISPVSAERFGGDSLRVRVRVSSAPSTAVEEVFMRSSSSVTVSNQLLRYENGNLILGNESIPIDTTPRKKITIAYSADRKQDAVYLNAAVHAAVLHEGKRDTVILQRLTVSNRASFQSDVLFWLSDDDLPQGVSATLIVRDAATRRSRTEPRRVSANGISFAVRIVAPAALTPLTSTPERIALWKDNANDAALTFSVDSLRQEIWFYSRFNPAWSEFVLEPLFAEWVLSLLYPLPFDLSSPLSPKVDRRTTPLAQVAPNETREPVYAMPTVRHALTQWLWGAAAVCFALERWLSHRRSVA
jgi:hypothetical protein